MCVVTNYVNKGLIFQYMNILFVTKSKNLHKFPERAVEFESEVK